jgi:hypothetical protein
VTGFALMLTDDTGRTIEIVSLYTSLTIIDGSLEASRAVAMTGLAPWINRII